MIQGIIEFIKNNIASITTNIISTIIYIFIATIILLIIRRLKEYLNPYKRIFGFQKKEKQIFLCYAMIRHNIRNRRIFLLEIGDVTALYNIYAILTKTYNRKRIIVQNHNQIHASLAEIKYFISISGPLYNSITEHYLGHLGSPVTFSRDKKSIIEINIKEEKNHQLYNSSYTEKGIVYNCHGIILSGQHITSTGTKQKLIICAGNSSMSTYTGILILRRLGIDISYRRQLNKNGIRFNKKWCILFQVRNLDEREIWNMSTPVGDSSLEYNIIKYYCEKDFLESYTNRF